MEFRLAMVQDRMKLGPQEALAYIQKMDQDRAKWTQYLYGVNWGDATYYDLVINLERMDIQEACEVIASTAKQKCFEETPESELAVEDLALASRVRANLAADPATAQLEVEVGAHSGAVTLRGMAYTPEQIKEIENLAWKVPGVNEIHTEVFVKTLDV
jgi:hypothetical protein